MFDLPLPFFSAVMMLGIATAAIPYVAWPLLILLYPVCFLIGFMSGCWVRKHLHG